MYQDIPINPPNKFCLAPFINTMQTPYGKTSPCAYGVTEWPYQELTAQERWHAPELEKMRQDFVSGKVPDPCQKCINEECAGKSSLRQRMWQWYPDAYNDIIRNGRWRQGPMIISTKVSNICNLSCRSCAGWDSNSFREEGEYYLREYQTQHPNTPGNRFIPRLPPKHTDYRGFADITENLVKMEFFGGEPLLNHTHFQLLEELIHNGRSRYVTLFYSTNCTQSITDRFLKIWQHFNSIEFSLSIDHIKDKFEYLRWPGRWHQVEANIHDILKIQERIGRPVNAVVATCATLNNVFYIDEIVDWAKETVGSSYINMVASPEYLALHIAPDDVKQAIADQINNSEVLGFMNLQPHNPLEWRRWIIWNRRQDKFRGQSFAKTFPEFYQAIRHHWCAVTDLSENSFNSDN